jgi:hypothetical protein
MVCATANYKHVQKRKKDVSERESKLAQWYAEKAERKERLREAKERLRQGSVCSTASTTSAKTVVLEEVALEAGSPPLSPISSVASPMEEDVEGRHIVGGGSKRGPRCGECAIQ